MRGGIARLPTELARRVETRLGSPVQRVELTGEHFTCTGQNPAIHYGKRAATNLLRAYPSLAS